MTPREIALKIIKTGGQILLPFDTGDASVKWHSRRLLADLIAKEIEEAVEHAYHEGREAAVDDHRTEIDSER